VPAITKDRVKDLPFSYEFFGQCFANGFLRENHETLDNSDKPKLFAIQLMFMGMNFKQVFENSLIARQNLSSLLKLPLTNERIEVSPNFKDAVDEVLAALPKRDLIDTKHPSLL
jgi:hypothetical protein